MSTMTIAQPIPTQMLRQRMLEVDGDLFLVRGVHHRHVCGQMVTTLDVEAIVADKYECFDGHNWRTLKVAHICGLVPADG